MKNRMCKRAFTKKYAWKCHAKYQSSRVLHALSFAPLNSGRHFTHSRIQPAPFVYDWRLMKLLCFTLQPLEVNLPDDITTQIGLFHSSVPSRAVAYTIKFWKVIEVRPQEGPNGKMELSWMKITHECSVRFCWYPRIRSRLAVLTDKYFLLFLQRTSLMGCTQRNALKIFFRRPGTVDGKLIFIVKKAEFQGPVVRNLSMFSVPSSQYRNF